MNTEDRDMANAALLLDAKIEERIVEVVMKMIYSNPSFVQQIVTSHVFNMRMEAILQQAALRFSVVTTGSTLSYRNSGSFY